MAHSQVPSVRVNRKGSNRIASGHPWIFSSDILDRGDAGAGDVVRVIDPKGRMLGMAHYSSASQIALRLLSGRGEVIDHPFFRDRLQQAIDYRARIVSGSDAYRLVHAEADRLPGLIIDYYAGHLVLQTLDQGMDRERPQIVACLEELLHPRGIVARNDVPVRALESLPLETAVVAGEVPDRVQVAMNGLLFEADLIHGQKTGVFLDQRQNYVAAARYAKGRALDCFTSTGGFALHIASSCQFVDAVDSSSAALETAEANKRLNQIENVAFREGDVFDFLSSRVQARNRYST
ncbi:MAG: class I SAM-dependent rRNA methyltransferase, partial [Bryobacteraceae bacterium]